MGYRWGGIQCTYRAGSSIPSPFKILILQIVQLSGWSILQKRRYPQPKVVGSILGCSKLLILSETGILDYSWKNPNFLKDLKIISFLWLCEPKLKATKIKETNIRYVPTRCGCTIGYGGSGIVAKKFGVFCTKICYFIEENKTKNGPLVFRIVLCS